MTFELYMLVAATLVGFVHLGAASFTYQAQVGTQYALGPRDEDVRRTGMAGRMQRAQANFNETYPYFAAFVLMVYLTDSAGAFSQWGTIMYLAGRSLFLPLYAWGVPGPRTASWHLASIGLLVAGVQLFV